MKWFPAPIPEPLRELYSWRNGQPKDAWESKHVFWFRDMQFTSLQRAAFEYRSMMESYGSVDADNIKYHGIALATSFPFASFNGGWYVIPCAPHTIDRTHPLPVVGVMEGVDVYFHSLEKMLDTCIDWRKHSTWEGDGWKLSESMEMEIWRRHNPGIFGAAI